MYAHTRGYITGSGGGGPVEPGVKINKYTIPLTNGTEVGQLIGSGKIILGVTLLKTSGTLTTFKIGTSSGASDILDDDAPSNAADGQMYSLFLTYPSGKTLYLKETGGAATATIYYY